MDGRGTFIGNFLQAVDAKGRIAVPAALRTTIERNSPEKVIVLAVDENRPCLIGYDRALPQERYAERKAGQAADRAAGRPVLRDDELFADFGAAEELTFDSSGRFVLPAFYRDELGLGEWAYFHSEASQFSIWDPRRALEADSILPMARKRLEHDLRARKVVLQ